MLLVLLLLAAPEKVEVGTYPVAVDAMADRVLGFAGEVNITISVWPKKITLTQTKRKLAAMSEQAQAENVYLLTVASNAVQSSLTQVLSSGTKTPPDVRRMLALLTVALDHVARDGLATAYLGVRKKGVASVIVALPEKQLAVECLFSPR